MENKLSLRYILDRILFDLVINKKDDINNINNEIIVVISPYKDIKKYLSFKLNEGSEEPLVKTISKIFNYTFYIYDDFYINKEYDEYKHMRILLPHGYGYFRVDYYNYKKVI